MTQYREILRMHSRGISQRSIANTLHCSRNTVSKVIRQAQERGLTWPLQDDLTEDRLAALLFPRKPQPVEHEPPDIEKIHREMKKDGVTLSLLWAEYCEECHASGKTPLMYSQFCHHYRQYRQKNKATMHIPRKPGEQIEVDWAGKTASLTDPDTGDVVKAYVFVGTLSYSQCAYVEAFLAQDLENWITAHVHMFEYFGGVAQILVPDNLKTGVSRADWYSPEIQKNYQDMAEHYDTVIVPARIKKPRDKANVEGNVGKISTWILAAIRHLKFFSLAELNDAIKARLEIYNHRPFQRKEGSRYSLLQEEKTYLLPLPKTPFELAIWKVATVQFNYHISVDGMYYSVPFEYIKQEVSVKVTRSTIEVFMGRTRLCSHPRLHGRKGQYNTVQIHMPPDHQKYFEWDSEYFVNWSSQVGPCAKAVVEGLLAQHKVKQQGIRACIGLLKLADKYSPNRLERSCQRALSFSASPSHKTVKMILDAGQDKLELNEQKDHQENDNSYAFTRGARHYGRKNQ
ncbi:MAG TPA: IS21 family transposase [Firmicutes bacterium]|nr:IS21 family transposase [Candidatus Fermentithermobacillaceae bacterium]